MRYLALALVAIATVGCAYDSGPRYERAEDRGDYGYYDVRLDENRYRVEYRTDYSDAELAQDFAMRRAAELALSQDYDWFQVIHRNRAFSDEFFGRYDPYRHEFRDGRYRDRPDFYDGRYDDSAMAVIEVVMGYDPPPGGSSIYDARRVLDYTSDYRRDYTDRYYYQRRPY
jgi:hypothetical protein